MVQGHQSQTSNPPITRFAWLAIATAVVTIAFKLTAYLLTDSVGLLSDALESVVNLVAALVALYVLSVATRQPDEEHAYGHAKAEYFSSGFEGLMIVLAAVSIGFTAVPRLLDPSSLDKVGFGLLVSIAASAINGAVAWRLSRAAKAYRSITLQASARHLLADVWTSVGVVIGVALVPLTGWTRLDPILALLVAANIVWTGIQLIRKSAYGLLDTAIPNEDLAKIERVFVRYRTEYGIELHALRTREAGARQFMSIHVVVPGDWTIDEGHRFVERLEHDIRADLPNITVFTHLESLNDPASWDDITLDRNQPRSFVTASPTHS